VRAFNESICLDVHVYGKPRMAWIEQMRELGARVFIGARVEDLPPTFLKWLPLAHAEYRYSDRLLFLDADTIAFGSLTALFTELCAHDFYAREELGTGQVGTQAWLGSIKVPGAIKPYMPKVRRGLGSREVPIFNTGVMVFNHGIHRTIAAALGEVRELCRIFVEGKLPYPCTNLHILEEVVISLILGRMNGVSFGTIPRELSPWYLEVAEGLVPDPGVVMHVWSARYAEYLDRFEGPAGRQMYLDMYGS